MKIVIVAAQFIADAAYLYNSPVNPIIASYYLSWDQSPKALVLRFS